MSTKLLQAAQFILQKNWLIAGSDDLRLRNAIKTWNWDLDWANSNTFSGHFKQWHQAQRRCKAGPLQGSVLSDDVSLRTIQHSLYGSVQLLGLVLTTWSAHANAAGCLFAPVRARSEADPAVVGGVCLAPVEVAWLAALARVVRQSVGRPS
ncbi:hypothetical protein H257_07779 [Aphanomyces astaci]|uniref:Uncharacterized protein n=1 Tax=Aphanomyces astaci TaxID=112090 RepID=W4GI67_APHAT|nr:hypothetical protein H257_07779 [Aphanomyces astaci]ETV78991.1 hypothetical protein H257_07779 [Aphanomyces astaci]|eukprot:XP_009831710.1 hypothetical protein H257_07779 [Aphanomyces astaci]